jgi:uncharacterized protein
MDERLEQHFDGVTLDPRLSWYCPPKRWQLDPSRGRLSVETDALTDYWQRTHYGFEVDNGHFLRLHATGDFVLTTQVSCFPRHQYDQAGLMLRLSPACWLKTSVEFEPDQPQNRLGAVVTNRQYSDWSTQPSSKQESCHWFRIRAIGGDCIVDTSLDGVDWMQIRVAHLEELARGTSVECGLYACSPKAAGFRAEFHFLRFEPASHR